MRRIESIKESRVTDGATLRHSRIMAMLQFIADTEGATTKDIQAFMFLHYGLKYRTTAEYIHECHLAGSIVLSQDGRWVVTEKFKKYLR